MLKVHLNLWVLTIGPAVETWADYLHWCMLWAGVVGNLVYVCDTDHPLIGMPGAMPPRLWTLYQVYNPPGAYIVAMSDEFVGEVTTADFAGLRFTLCNRAMLASRYPNVRSAEYLMRETDYLIHRRQAEIMAENDGSDEVLPELIDVNDAGYLEGEVVNNEVELVDDNDDE